MDPGSRVAIDFKLGPDRWGDRHEGVRPAAAARDRSAESAPGLPGDVADQPGALGAEHDRKPAAPRRTQHGVSIMLEHRDVRQIDLVAGKPAGKFAEVERRADEPEARGRQPLDAQRTGTDDLMDLDRREPQVSPRGQDGHVHPFGGKGESQVVQYSLGATDQGGIAPGDERDLHPWSRNDGKNPVWSGGGPCGGSTAT